MFLGNRLPIERITVDSGTGNLSERQPNRRVRVKTVPAWLRLLLNFGYVDPRISAGAVVSVACMQEIPRVFFAVEEAVPDPKAARSDAVQAFHITPRQLFP